MAVTFGFYNSVGGDRKYDALQISSIFDGLVTDGVYELYGDAFAPSEDTGVMGVLIGTGRAWFNHTWTLNDAVLALAIADSHATLPRIDAVILEVDSSLSVRQNAIKVLTGTPASVPVEPTLTNNATLHQYPLCWVSVGAAVSSIVTADITNLVGSGLCPFVTVPQASGGVASVLEHQIFS